jgi:hypothetical protein
MWIGFALYEYGKALESTREHWKAGQHDAAKNAGCYCVLSTLMCYFHPKLVLTVLTVLPSLLPALINPSLLKYGDGFTYGGRTTRLCHPHSGCVTKSLT